MRMPIAAADSGRARVCQPFPAEEDRRPWGDCPKVEERLTGDCRNEKPAMNGREGKISMPERAMMIMITGLADHCVAARRVRSGTKNRPAKHPWRGPRRTAAQRAGLPTRGGKKPQGRVRPAGQWEVRGLRRMFAKPGGLVDNSTIAGARTERHTSGRPGAAPFTASSTRSAKKSNQADLGIEERPIARIRAGFYRPLS